MTTPTHSRTMDGYFSPRCQHGMAGCNDLACVCTCHRSPVIAGCDLEGCICHIVTSESRPEEADTPPLRDQLAAALATAGHCDHPGADSCSAWWQADAVLPIVAALQADNERLQKALNEADDEITRLMDHNDTSCTVVAERDRLAGERDEARAWVERTRLAIAVYGEGIDPDGLYAGTPGSRVQELLRAEAERDAMRPVVEAAVAFREAAARPEHGHFWRQPWSEMADLCRAVDAMPPSAPPIATESPDQGEVVGQGTEEAPRLAQGGWETRLFPEPIHVEPGETVTVGVGGESVSVTTTTGGQIGTRTFAHGGIVRPGQIWNVGESGGTE